MGTPLKNQFDRWVEKARTSAQEDQLDRSLGALFGVELWCFHNVGEADAPSPAAVEMEGATTLLVFSDTDHLDEFTLTTHRREPGQPLAFFLIPVEEASDYCQRFRELGVTQILVNPGPYAFACSLDTLARYHAAWMAEGGRVRSAIHLPNGTTFEQEFWEENEGAILSGENILRPGSSGFDQWIEDLAEKAKSSD